MSALTWWMARRGLPDPLERGFLTWRKSWTIPRSSVDEAFLTIFNNSALKEREEVRGRSPMEAGSTGPSTGGRTKNRPSGGEREGRITPFPPSGGVIMCLTSCSSWYAGVLALFRPSVFRSGRGEGGGLTVLWEAWISPFPRMSKTFSWKVPWA